MERLTIEEAIAFCHEKSNNIKLKAEPQVFIQLAEWLEELKKRRSEDYGYMADIHQSIGYRQALDDFAEKINAKCDGMIKDKWNSNVAPISWAEAYADFKDDIDEIAEQLKAGWENE